MGSRDSKSSSTTNYSGQYVTPPTTPQMQQLEAWQPDETLLNSGIASDYSAARRATIEGTGGYSGINNPVLASRMQQIGLQELSDKEASSMADANQQRNLLKLGQLESAARLGAPQYVTTGAQTQNVQAAPSLLGTIIGGGLSVAAAF